MAATLTALVPSATLAALVPTCSFSSSGPSSTFVVLWVPEETVNIAVDVTGIGDVNTAVSLVRSVMPSAVAVGVMTVTPTAVLFEPLSFSAIGSLSTQPTALFSISANAESIGSVQALAAAARGTSATFSGVGSVTSSAAARKFAAVDIGASSAFLAAATAMRGLSFDVSAPGALEIIATAIKETVLTFTASGSAETQTASLFNVAVDVTSTGTVTIAASSAGAVDTSVDITAVGTFGTAAVYYAGPAVGADAADSVEVAATAILSAAPTIEGIGAIAATASAIVSTMLGVSASGSAEVATTALRVTSVAFTGVGAASIFADIPGTTQDTAIDIAAAGGFDAAATANLISAMSLLGTGSLSIVTSADMEVENTAVSGVGAFSIEGQAWANAAVAYTGTGSITNAASALLRAVLSIVGTGAFTSSASALFGVSQNYSATGNVTIAATAAGTFDISVDVVGSGAVDISGVELDVSTGALAVTGSGASDISGVELDVSTGAIGIVGASSVDVSAFARRSVEATAYAGTGTVAIEADVVSGASGVTIGYESTFSSSDLSSATQTFTSQDIGTAAANRRVYAVIGTRGASAFSSVTIGGQTAVREGIQYAGTLFRIEIWSAAVSSGGTGTIVCELNSSGGSWLVGHVYAAYGTSLTTTFWSNDYNDTTPEATVWAWEGSAILSGVVGNPTGGTAVSWSAFTEGQESNSPSLDDVVASAYLSAVTEGGYLDTCTVSGGSNSYVARVTICISEAASIPAADYESDFSTSDLDGFSDNRSTSTSNVDSIGGEDDVLQSVMDSTTNRHGPQRGDLSTSSHTYVITGRFHIDAGNALCDGLQIASNSQFPNFILQPRGEWIWFGAYITNTTNAWVQWQMMDNTATYFAGNGTDKIYLKDVKIWDVT